MSEFEIHCVIQDSFGVILQVGIGDETVPVNYVVNWILKDKHSFFTMKSGFKAKVYAKKHPTSGRWFLTTEADSTKENNLDFLPKCV